MSRKNSIRYHENCPAGEAPMDSAAAVRMTDAEKIAASLDEAIAARWPDSWARANDPSLRNRSKARNNLRKQYRSAVLSDAFVAANPEARCSNCDNAKRDPTPGIRGLVCLIDSDFHGYQMVNEKHVCLRWTAEALVRAPTPGAQT